jgi:CBS domain-containing protein
MIATEPAERHSAAVEGLAGQLRATTIMSSPVHAVTADTPLTEVLTAMLRTGHHHMTVVTRGQLLGILTDRALASVWAADPVAFTHVRAGQVVDRPASIARDRATVCEVAAIMVRDGVDAVAIVAGTDHPMGIVTSTDLVALLARTFRSDTVGMPVGD